MIFFYFFQVENKSSRQSLPPLGAMPTQSHRCRRSRIWWASRRLGRMRGTDSYSFFVVENFFLSPSSVSYADSRCDCVGICHCVGIAPWGKPLARSPTAILSIRFPLIFAKQNDRPDRKIKDLSWSGQRGKPRSPPTILRIRLLGFCRQAKLRPCLWPQRANV